ncbi:3-deoxy-8-phosphooctulonate synthase [bacterium]|nr:3-deoxy-8-phosphooctulonate synthase [bacterium]
MKVNTVSVGGDLTKKITIANNLPFTLIAGPCQLQDRDLAMKICERLIKITDKLGINYIFKGSYDKANRNSITGARGIGIDEGIKIFDEIRSTFKVPVMTDVHTNEQASIIAPHVDMIQQPAFLIRQTDLSLAIAKTGKCCNLKKGQFQAPWDMKNIIKKYESAGNTNICLTERGTSFGYGDLIVDSRSFINMAETGYPVIVDATHSVQRPSAMGDSSGGEARLAPIIARSALSTGVVGGVYIETHPEPLKGGSDIYNAIPLMYMEETLTQLKAIDEVAKSNKARLEDWNQEGEAI